MGKVVEKNRQEREVAGTLSEIRFHKANFLIGILDNGIAVKGNMAVPQVGLEYRFYGAWTHSPRWGDSFLFSTYKRSYPKSAEAIRLYLEENAKWVGPEISQKIIAAYGEEALVILKKEPERVAKEISGITEARALEVSAMLRSMEEHEEMEVALNGVLGDLLAPRLRHKVLELWGPDAPAKIRQNPYQLIEALTGVGFLTADRIAHKVGFAVEGYPRIKAGIVHALQEAAWNAGHTFLPRNLLALKARDLLRLNTETIDAVIPLIAEERAIVLEESTVYLPSLRSDEKVVADRLKAIKGKL